MYIASLLTLYNKLAATVDSNIDTIPLIMLSTNISCDGKIKYLSGSLTAHYIGNRHQGEKLSSTFTERFQTND